MLVGKHAFRAVRGYADVVPGIVFPVVIGSSFSDNAGGAGIDHRRRCAVVNLVLSRHTRDRQGLGSNGTAVVVDVTDIVVIATVAVIDGYGRDCDRFVAATGVFIAIGEGA